MNTDKISENHKCNAIKRFWRWRFRNAAIILMLIIINGTMVIAGVYPEWIGYFNLLFVVLPLIIRSGW